MGRRAGRIAKEPSHLPSLHIFVSSFLNVIKDTQIYFASDFLFKRNGQENVGKGKKLALEHVMCHALCWELGGLPKPSNPGLNRNHIWWGGPAELPHHIFSGSLFFF